MRCSTEGFYARLRRRAAGLASAAAAISLHLRAVAQRLRQDVRSDWSRRERSSRSRKAPALAGGGSVRMGRARTLLPFACAAGAVLLFGSQFTAHLPFDAVNAGSTGRPGQRWPTSPPPTSTRSLVLGRRASRPRAVADPSPGRYARRRPQSRVAGVRGDLLIFLHRPSRRGQDRHPQRRRESFVDAKAEPQRGFWFELIGAAAAVGVRRAPWRR